MSAKLGKSRREAWPDRNRLAIAIFVFLALVNALAIWGYGRDIPYFDEWWFLKPEQLPSGLSLEWLFSVSNEHRIVPTKLENWLFLELADWNLLLQLQFNYLVFLAGIGLLLRFFMRGSAGLPLWVGLAFIAFMLSPRLAENHLWAFQSQFHFCWIFLLLGAWYLFMESASDRSTALGTACLLACAYSFSAGLVAAAVMTGSYVARLVIRKWQRRQSASRVSRQLLIVLIPTLAGYGLWFVGYPDLHPSLTWPHWLAFGKYFLALCGYAFAIDSTSDLLGLVALSIILAPIPSLIVLAVKHDRSDAWSTLAMTASLLAILALITLGRTLLDTPRSSRYAEFATLLVPINAMAWSQILQHRVAARRRVIRVVFWFCFFFNLDGWLVPLHYHGRAYMRDRGIECVDAYYHRGGDGDCPEIHPEPIGPYLDVAKDMNVSFYQRSLAAEKARASERELTKSQEPQLE